MPLTDSAGAHSSVKCSTYDVHLLFFVFMITGLLQRRKQLLQLWLPSKRELPLLRKTTWTCCQISTTGAEIAVTYTHASARCSLVSGVTCSL